MHSVRLFNLSNSMKWQTIIRDEQNGMHYISMSACGLMMLQNKENEHKKIENKKKRFFGTLIMFFGKYFLWNQSYH